MLSTDHPGRLDAERPNGPSRDGHAPPGAWTAANDLHLIVTDGGLVEVTAENRALDFAIGHVLFLDIVGYSKLLLHEQGELLRDLKGIVRSTLTFRRAENAGTLLCLPTGDGMALVFRSSPEEPAQCALDVSAAVKSYPKLRLRMGVHSGPVNEVSDVNERANIAGAGINVAQRVMDCGDDGHILLSQHVAEDLEHSARWQSMLHPLGVCEVKHGVSISLVNLFTKELGNPAVPSRLKKLGEDARSNRRRLAALTGAALLLIALAMSVWWTRQSSSNIAVAPAPVHVAKVPDKSIAVLPFENLSSSQETAFFTDGVHDEILTDLARVADLKVISRTSVMQYRDPARRNLREIARQLGVAHVVEGSVQRDGNRIRVNAQLIDARTDAHLWAHTFDSDLADVFAVQSEIARSIAEQLQAKISSREAEALNAKPTGDLKAYDFYLQATQIARQRASSIGSGGIEDTRHELALLEQATAQDPSFVPAICLLAQTHLYLHWLNNDPSGNHLEKARHEIETAARLQPDSGELHFTRAVFYYWGSRDYGAALAELDLARRILPNDTRTLFMSAMILRRQNKWDEAIRKLDQALAFDPASVTVLSEVAGTYEILRRYAVAEQILARGMEWNPEAFSLGLLRADLDYLWKADLRRWQEVVNSDAAKNADRAELLAARLSLALLQRNFHEADRVLGLGGGNEFDDNGFFAPREWKESIVARGLGDQTRADAALKKARERAAAGALVNPSDPRALMTLAQIDAAIGHEKEASEEGERAVALMPIAKDAIIGNQLITRLTKVYAQLGAAERALTLLEQNQTRPYWPDYGSLTLDPVWDSLRGNPRFERLRASVSPKL